MKVTLSALALVLVAGCGASVPPPNTEYAAAQRDLGRAQEGGGGIPNAELHMRLAQEDLAKAKTLMGDDAKNNDRAASLIARSSAESELATSLAREARAHAGSVAAASQTTTTSAVLPAKSP